jgi:hypothetical protein
VRRQCPSPDVRGTMSERPAPTSLNSRTRSKSTVSIPAFRSAIAAESPPIPVPITIAFTLDTFRYSRDLKIDHCVAQATLGTRMFLLQRRRLGEILSVMKRLADGDEAGVNYAILAYQVVNRSSQLSGDPVQGLARLDYVDSTASTVLQVGPVLHSGSFLRSGLVLRGGFVLECGPVLRGGCALSQVICGHLFDGDSFLRRWRPGDTVRMDAAIRAGDIYVVHAGS